MPRTRSSRLAQKNPTQEAQVLLLVSILFEDIYLVYFLFGTNRPKGVKGTQVVVNRKCLLSGPAFPMESPIKRKSDPFLSRPLSLYRVPNHCSALLLKAEHTVAGAKGCGCVCLRLRLLSDLRQLAEEILFQNSEP